MKSSPKSSAPLPPTQTSILVIGFASVRPDLLRACRVSEDTPTMQQSGGGV